MEDGNLPQAFLPLIPEGAAAINLPLLHRTSRTEAWRTRRLKWGLLARGPTSGFSPRSELCKTLRLNSKSAAAIE